MLRPPTPSGGARETDRETQRENETKRACAPRRLVGTYCPPRVPCSHRGSRLSPPSALACSPCCSPTTTTHAGCWVPSGARSAGVLGSYYQEPTVPDPPAGAQRDETVTAKPNSPAEGPREGNAERRNRNEGHEISAFRFRGSFPRIRTEKHALTWATHTRTTSMESTRRRHRAAHIGACGLGSIGRRFLKLRPRRHHGPPHAGLHQRSRWLTRAQTPRCARPPLPHQRRGSRVCSRVDRNGVRVLTLRARRLRCWRPHSWPRRSA